MAARLAITGRDFDSCLPRIDLSDTVALIAQIEAHQQSHVLDVCRNVLDRALNACANRTAGCADQAALLLGSSMTLDRLAEILQSLRHTLDTMPIRLPVPVGPAHETPFSHHRAPIHRALGSLLRASGYDCRRTVTLDRSTIAEDLSILVRLAAERPDHAQRNVDNLLAATLTLSHHATGPHLGHDAPRAPASQQSTAPSSADDGAAAARAPLLCAALSAPIGSTTWRDAAYGTTAGHAPAPSALRHWAGNGMRLQHSLGAAQACPDPAFQPQHQPLDLTTARPPA